MNKKRFEPGETTKNLTWTGWIEPEPDNIIWTGLNRPKKKQTWSEPVETSNRIELRESVSWVELERVRDILSLDYE